MIVLTVVNPMPGVHKLGPVQYASIDPGGTFTSGNVEMEVWILTWAVVIINIRTYRNGLQLVPSPASPAQLRRKEINGSESLHRPGAPQQVSNPIRTIAGWRPGVMNEELQMWRVLMSTWSPYSPPCFLFLLMCLPCASDSCFCFN